MVREQDGEDFSRDFIAFEICSSVGVEWLLALSVCFSWPFSCTFDLSRFWIFEIRQKNENDDWWFTHLSTLFFSCYLYPQQTTKVPKEFIVLGGAAILGLVLLFGVGAGVLTAMIGFVYPTFKSFEAIESKQKGDDVQWLVFWIVFAFFSVIENFIDFLLYWIPFYYAGKLAFLLWAMLPQTKGAKFLYDSVLKDFLKKNESRIDAAMADAKKVGRLMLCAAYVHIIVETDFRLTSYRFVWSQSADTMASGLAANAAELKAKVDEATKDESKKDS